MINISKCFRCFQRIKMGHTTKRIFQSVTLLMFAGVYCGEWCEANYKTGVLRKYCDVGGCCFPADQNSYNDDTDFCCVSLLTVILISVFVGIPAIILILVCCVCCIKYLKSKNKTQSFQPNQDAPNGSAPHHTEPKPQRPVYMIGPPSYHGTHSAGSEINIPGIPDYRLRARALSPPPPYSARSTEEEIYDTSYVNTSSRTETRQIESRSQERTITRVDNRGQNNHTSVNTIAQVLSNRSTRLASRTARNVSRTDTQLDITDGRSSTTSDGRSSNIGDHLEFI